MCISYIPPRRARTPKINIQQCKTTVSTNPKGKKLRCHRKQKVKKSLSFEDCFSLSLTSISEATMIHARKTILAKSGLGNQQQHVFISDFDRLSKETILATYPAWRNHPHSCSRYKATRHGILWCRLPSYGGGMSSIENQ